MKPVKLIFVFLFYFITSFSYSQGECLIEIDTATGSYNQIGGAIAGIVWVFPYIRAYDETHSAYIFQGGASLVDHLYSIDVTNGSIISNPYFAPSGSSVREPKYDNIKDTLYGLYWNSSLSQFFLASINPTTGIYAQVGTIPILGLGGISQGSTAYDEINHRYFALQNNQLFSIEASNGNLISNSTLNLLPGEQLLHFCYNNSANILNGLLQNSNTQICYLVSINTTTGVITKIGNGNFLGAGGGSSSIDKINQRYIYIYTTGGSNYYITTLDISTGNVIANKSIPLSTGDNIHSIAFDNIKNKLYGIQWDADALAPPPCQITVNSASVCYGNSCILTASGGTAYLWSNGATGNSIAVFPLSHATYTITGTDGSNCSSTAVTNVYVNILPTVTANTTATTVCAGSSATLTGLGASSYLWTGGVINGVGFVPSSTHTYTVIGTDANNCSNTDTTTITVIPLAITTVGLIASATTICSGSSFILTGTGASSYLWSDGSTTSGITVFNSGAYWVQDNSMQCSNKDSLFISDVNCETEIEVPNIFTPNNDGLNDVFKMSTKNVTTINCKIYNRWGILVSELKTINEVWDGNTIAGLQCTVGVYYLIIDYQDSTGTNHLMKGFVQLFR